MAESSSAVSIALIYPALLGTYGDGGNALVLAQRLRWRGYGCQVHAVSLQEPLPRHADVYVLGGGEDAAQTLAVRRLGASSTLADAAAAGRPIFAVCAGYQILGRSFVDGTGATYPGLGLIDCETSRLPGPRAVGELLAYPRVPPGRPLAVLTGYENHAGQTVLGPAAQPLATVAQGVGNGDGTEGAVQGSVVATYAHGPALARNPELADYLLALAVGPLPTLEDAEEEALRRERLDAVLHRGHRRRRSVHSPPSWRRAS